MSESTLSFASTQTFRNNLLGRNLPPYRVTGAFSPSGPRSYISNISDYNVIDSPGENLVNGKYSNILYPLNEYGPNGGYNLTITYNGPPLAVNSNKGEYDLTDSELELINEFFIDAAFVSNKYGPEGGFNSIVVIDDQQIKEKLSLPYWDPLSFRSSSYSPYSILLENNPVGSDGSLSNDSYIARLGAENLRRAFEARISAENYKNNLGVVTLESLKDPFDVATIAKGKKPLIYKDYIITVPKDDPNKKNQQLVSRLGGAYWPTSPIPGDYFDEEPITTNALTPQVSAALNVVNALTGGYLGPSTIKSINPSEIFIENTGSGQVSALFDNINYNKYKPDFKKSSDFTNPGQINIGSRINEINNTTNSSYYVGSRDTDPSKINSPPNQVPVNPYGKQEQIPVYGPSELAILYEGNINQLNFGLPSKPLIDAGSIDGNFVWTSPRYKGNAGFKSTPGGGSGSLDKQFNQISSSYQRGESTKVTFKQGSILDNTQRLINSADNVSGIAKLKHVGNAINQVSKVFNDGYKEMTKGSQVVSYKDFTDGSEKGVEYCRVFTKDTPYYTYADLQKTDGITKSGRRFTNSVLDNTFNLNISPLKGVDSTNLVPNNDSGTGGYAKKYMFSIENLAWRTSSRPDFRYDDLPVCEKGPNGGRVMWFPPYDLKFSDSSAASFNGTEFLGRPEPIYTYKSTTRTGTLSWKIIVDNPSVTNIVIEQQLKGANKEKINSIVDSFFAGCVKYDIYKLAQKFNTIPSKDLVTYQTILSNPRLTDEELKAITVEIPAGNTGGEAQYNIEKKQEEEPDVISFKEKYTDMSVYFDHDIPFDGSTPYDDTYQNYVSESRKNKYKTNSEQQFNENTNFCKKNVDYCVKQKNVETFFGIIEDSNSTIESFKDDLIKLFEDKKITSIKIKMVGSASKSAGLKYNIGLSKRRVDSFSNYLKKDTTLNEKITDGSIQIIEEKKGFDEEVTPKDFDTIYCKEPLNSGIDGKPNDTSKVYSLFAMACRKTRVTDINITDVKKNVEVKTLIEPQKNPDIVKIQPIKPKPNVETRQKLKEGLTKKILRNLLTECDYFQVVKENNPMIYDTIKEKIKYFNPAFHSMTPEGLNARLTFLNQCVRPGETIPVIDQDGKPKFNDALNTSFGTPPVLILRIGDFYNTKIIPDNVSFSYEPLVLDINPEGIGVQPMIVNVSMNFKMIGGHGLKEPVNRLQNALSFNYYANTEIYDERAVPTEDTSKLDKQIFDSILEKEKPATTNNLNNEDQNNGGTTIGDILTNKPVDGGQTGETSYQKIMDLMFDSTHKYAETIFNTSEKIVKSYNYGILQLLTKERLYNTGLMGTNQSQFAGGIGKEVNIFGAPKTEYVKEQISKIFLLIKDDIDLDFNPIIKKFKKDNDNNFTQNIFDQVKQNMKDYLDVLSNNYSNGIFTILQDSTTAQQDYVQLIRKLNFISNEIDGKISGNVPLVYLVSGSDEVSKKKTSGADIPTNTYKEFTDDYKKVMDYLEKYYDFLVKQNVISDQYGAVGKFVPINSKFPNDEEGEEPFFIIMSRILQNKSKREEFVNQIIKGDVLKKDSDILKEFKKATNYVADYYDDELDAEERAFSKLGKSKEYKNFIKDEDLLYPKGKTRKFTYTTVPNSEIEENKKRILNLYSTTNINTDNKTFNGKIKFDS
jgi:hypothetical protein